jgi:hypothetical protein
MERIDAIKNARIGAFMGDGMWYVTRRHGRYSYMHSDEYRGTVDGVIVKTFTPQIVRRTTPPEPANVYAPRTHRSA